MRSGLAAQRWGSRAARSAADGAISGEKALAWGPIAAGRAGEQRAWQNPGDPAPLGLAGRLAWGKGVSGGVSKGVTKAARQGARCLRLAARRGIAARLADFGHADSSSQSFQFTQQPWNPALEAPKAFRSRASSPWGEAAPHSPLQLCRSSFCSSHGRRRPNAACLLPNFTLRPAGGQRGACIRAATVPASPRPMVGLPRPPAHG